MFLYIFICFIHVYVWFYMLYIYIVTSFYRFYSYTVGMTNLLLITLFSFLSASCLGFLFLGSPSSFFACTTAVCSPQALPFGPFSFTLVPGTLCSFSLRPLRLSTAGNGPLLLTTYLSSVNISSPSLTPQSTGILRLTCARPLPQKVVLAVFRFGHIRKTVGGWGRETEIPFKGTFQGMKSAAFRSQQIQV